MSLTAEAEMTRLGPEDKNFFPDPHQNGLAPFYRGVLWGPQNKAGVSDPMTVACAQLVQRPNESLDHAWQRIGDAYVLDSHEPGFEPGPSDVAFYKKHFIPPQEANPYVMKPGETVPQAAAGMREQFSRLVSCDQGFDLGQPREMIGSGGRYNLHEYGWDGYHEAKGWAAAGRWDLVRNKAVNQASMIERFGFVPNGTARFYLDRPQPPYFSHLVRMLAEHEGKQVLCEFMPAIDREIEYFMQGDPDNPLRDPINATESAVRMPEGETLFRYPTSQKIARLEQFAYDERMADLAAGGLIGVARDQRRTAYFKHARTGAGTGLDYLPNQCSGGRYIQNIESAHRVHLSLSSLLVDALRTSAEAHKAIGDHFADIRMEQARSLVRAINKYHRNDTVYTDFDFVRGQPVEPDITMAYPMYNGFTDPRFGRGVIRAMEDYVYPFPGGVVTTLNEAPNFNWGRQKSWPFAAWLVTRAAARMGHVLGMKEMPNEPLS
jgi:alpha,alpha-trehalase